LSLPLRATSPHRAARADKYGGDSAACPHRCAGRLDTLMNLIGELLIARGRLTQLAASLVISRSRRR
jgi:chemotaxis protein histidine kinase CheA